MSTLTDFKAAVPRLTRQELAELREWLDEFCEDQLELTDEVKRKLDQSRAEVAAGDFTVRQPA
jgi:hypothetical protein